MRLMTLAALLIPTSLPLACIADQAEAVAPQPPKVVEKNEIKLVLDEDGKRYEFSGEDKEALLENLRKELKGQDDAAEVEAKVMKALDGIHMDVAAIEAQAKAYHRDEKTIRIQVEKAMADAEKALEDAQQQVREIEIRLASKDGELAEHIQHLELHGPGGEDIHLLAPAAKLDADTLLRLIEKAELSDEDKKRLAKALK